MSAPSASAEGDGHPDLPLSRSGASGGVVGLPAPPRMLLSDSQAQTEHVLAYWLAVEFIRVAEPVSASVTAEYANGVLDNARLLSGGNPRLFLNLLRHQVRWLRRLPVGSGELR